MTLRGVLLLLVATSLVAAGCVSDNGRPGKSSKEAGGANTKLGVAYMQQGNLSLAKEKLERAEKQDPRNPEVHTSLAYLYEQLGQNDKADSQYATALRLSPHNAQVANNYAVFLCRNGKPDQAMQRFETAYKDPLYNTPWAAMTNAGVCLRSAKRGPEGVKYFEQALTLRPNYAPAVLELAEQQLDEGKADLSGNVVERYLTMGAATPEILMVGLRAAIARGDKLSSDNYARRLRRDFPNSVQTRALPQLLGDRG